MEIVDLGLSAAGGGLFGVAGALAGRIIGLFEIKERRRDQALANEHEERRWKQEHEMQLLQLQSRREETESELALAESAGSWSALGASYAAEAAIGATYQWVEAVRALVRPGLTLGLWCAVLAIFFHTASEQARWLAATDRASALAYLIDSVVFAATAATLWWFGDRPPRRPAAG